MTPKQKKQKPQAEINALKAAGQPKRAIRAAKGAQGAQLPGKNPALQLAALPGKGLLPNRGVSAKGNRGNRGNKRNKTGKRNKGNKAIHTTITLADPLNIDELRALQRNPVLRKNGVSVSPITVANITGKSGKKNKGQKGRNGTKKMFKGIKPPSFKSEVGKVFDWESFALGNQAVEVGPDSYDVAGTPVGSISAVTTRPLKNGEVKYVEAPIASSDGYVKLYRIPAGAGINIQQIVKSLERSEKLDSILNGPAGYQEVQGDLEDAIKNLGRATEDLRHMRNTYSGAVQEGKISSAQIIQLQKIIPILSAGIDTREKELQSLTAQKAIVDATLLQTGSIM
jgi:hypothetical protein